jgi:peroxiredoxin
MLKRSVLSALFASAATAGSVSAAAELAIGDKLEPFALKDAGGTLVDLAAAKGHKARVVIFMATQCPVSNAYNGRMAALATEYAARGIAFYGVNSNRQETAAEVAEHARTHGFSFPVLKDEGNVQADRFGAEHTPEVYVFDAEWKLRYHGRIDDARDESAVTQRDLRSALDALLAGKSVPTPETKAFGCTIKRVTQ